MRRVVLALPLLLGCASAEPAPAPREPAVAPETSTAAVAVPQPTPDERRDAEALAARFVASFDEIERAFAGGRLDDAPLRPIVGVQGGGCWAYSGEKAFDVPVADDRPWSTVLGRGGPPDVSFSLGPQRLEVGIYRAPAGVVLFRTLRDVLVLETKRGDAVTQKVYEIATAGVFLPAARVDELLRPQPTPDERRNAEALAARFVAAFEQVEEAFKRGEMEIAPFEVIRGEDPGPVWSTIGTDLIETPRRAGQPESVAWCTVMGVLGGTLPDVAFTLEEHRLEVGVYRTDAEGSFVRPAGIVLFRVMKDVPGASTQDSVVDDAGTRRVVATQQVHEVATAGVLVSSARLKELVGDR